MKRLLRAIEVLAWASFFALAAVVLAVRFWVLPDIERYREEIVAAISRGVGLPVRVGAIQAGWLGLRPHIALTDVRIYDKQGREALVLPSIENVVGWRSLLHRELRLHSVVIERPRLTVLRDAAGDLYVAGLKIGRTGGGGDGGFGAWLLAQHEILIRGAEIEWRDDKRGAPPLAFSGLELRIVNAGSWHSAGLKARTPPELGGSIEARAVLEGDEPHRALSGRFFLELGYTDLSAWRAWLDYPFPVRRGQGALRAWLTLDKGALKEGTADVALADVDMTLADELAPLALASVQGRIFGRALADGVEFSGRGLALVLDKGPEIPRTDFEVVWRPQAGGLVGASQLDLDSLRHLAGSLPLPPQLSAAIAELAPRGRLADSRLEWSGPFDAPARYSARMRFADLAVRSRDGAPGFSGLSGSLDMTQDKGKLALASRNSTLELPRVFAQPTIELDSLAGHLDWERERGALTLRIASLTFANAHASGNVFGAYSRRGEGPGSIDLSGVLNRVDAAHTGRYLPSVLPEGPRNWLTNGIRAGEASDVRVRLRGDLRQFPFVDPASGHFQVMARIEKGQLEYAKGWPRIDNIVGELTFERDRMEIVGRSGSILGAQLSNVRVVMPTLRGPERHVAVSGQADGPTAEFLKFLHASPLRETGAAFVGGMKADGRGKLRLKLDLPLAELAKTRVSGEYDFGANQVTVLPWLPPVEAASGRVTFGEAGFTLHDVRGRFMGGPVGISGGTRAGRGVEILARGDASIDAAGPLFDHPLRKHLSGSFGYFLTVRAEEGAARVSFESPLRGLESSLPAPLAKSAADSLPLRVEVNPVARGERDRVVISLGTLARVELQRRRQGESMETQRAAVWLTPGKEPIRLSERPGTLVYGSLEAFDFDRWSPLLTANEPKPDSPPVSLELKIGTLDAFRKRLSNVSLRASAEAAGWSANLTADELAGDVSYRLRPQPRVIARLSRFSVPADVAGKPKPAPRPSDYPALDLVAEEFTFRGMPLGRVELVASRAGEDWRVERAAMVNAEASVSGRGTWQALPSRTALQFELEAGDAGGFLTRVGQPGTVKGGKARLQGTLAWQGNPATLDFSSLSGQVQMQAENGQFLEIEPGLGKLIGLMSLQALPRRITLDFRDVFSKGFQFDRIVANAEIDAGLLTLREFRMRGSAAEVEMRGELHLADETQNLRVRVLPSLADSASLGIGIVNPVAGVAAVIAQRILKNPLGQIFAFDYDVSGSWTDPKVVKVPPPALPEQYSN